MERQRKLNVIERIVNLHLDQIHYFEVNKLPEDFHQVLIFRSDNIEELRKRIQVLDDEKPLRKNEKLQAKEKYKEFQNQKKALEVKS